MPIIHAILLGLVQGLTEFLPVSSSGHLALLPWLFGWDDFGGDGLLEAAFDVALHLGTLLVPSSTCGPTWSGTSRPGPAGW